MYLFGGGLLYYHHTKTKGDLAVLKCQLDLFEKGFLILLPQTEHALFDVVAYKEQRFWRIQVKYRNMNENGTIRIKFQHSYSTKNGVQTQDVDKSQIDLYCVYCPETDQCYYFDPKLFNKSVTIRLKETKNNQAKGVYFAADFLEIP